MGFISLSILALLGLVSS